MQQSAVGEDGSNEANSRRSTPTPSESLTAMQRFALRPLRRSSSRIQRWVQDQQKRHSGGESADSAPGAGSDGADSPASASGCHPWLAFPHLNASAVAEHEQEHDNDDLSTVEESFVLVEGDDELDEVAADGRNVDAVVAQAVDLSSTPATPRKSRQATISFNTPSPLRNFARNLSSSRRFSSTGAPPPPREPSPTRGSSIFQRQTRISTPSRAPSLASQLFAQRQARETPSDATTIASTASHWRLRRPSVMGHFASGSEPVRAEEAQIPRPSTSSSVTRSSETIPTRTSLDSSCGNTQQKYPGYGTVRSHTPTALFAPTPSLWSLPRDASHMNDPPGSTKVLAHDRSNKPGSVRIPLTLKSSANVNGFGTGVLHPPKHKKKRKLVISGIPPGDQRRYDHVQMWCESFGELNQITRMPNGDLHVDFRRTEVADTVCRLHARVHINGVGSVGLSWFTGKRP